MLPKQEAQPRGKGSGLRDEPAGYVDAPRVRHPYARAVELLADSAERENAAWGEGYGFGFRAGIDVGERVANEDMARAWAQLREIAIRTANAASFAELQRRRSTPHGPAYFHAVLRHGGTEFAGVGRPRVPAPAAALEDAETWSRRSVEWSRQGVA